MSKHNVENFMSILGNVFSTALNLASSWVANQTSLVEFGSGMENTTMDSQQDPELTQALSFGFGIGSSSYTPDPKVIVTLADNKPSTKVEEKAKKIYDKYDLKHIKEKDEGATMIVVDSTAKELVDNIIDSSSTKMELIRNLMVLEEAIINTNQSQDSNDKIKVKK